MKWKGVKTQGGDNSFPKQTVSISFVASGGKSLGLSKRIVLSH